MYKRICIFILSIIYIINYNVQCITNQEDNGLLNNQTTPSLSKRAEECPQKEMCRSGFGYCGVDPEYCGDGCVAGPCYKTILEKAAEYEKSKLSTKAPKHYTKKPRYPTWKPRYRTTKPTYRTTKPRYRTAKPTYRTTKHPYGDNKRNIITEKRFQCAFNDLDDYTRRQRFSSLGRSGWKPVNADEAAVFLAHVSRETDGLRSLEHYCAPDCGPNFATSWCAIQGAEDKSYYGRGWFRLSFPCNYYAAGQALGLDLLNNPDLVSQKQDIAVKTAVWFFKTNNMAIPAQKGDFATTTSIITGKLECKGGSEAAGQHERVELYKRIRRCFGLGKPTINPTC